MSRHGKVQTDYCRTSHKKRFPDKPAAVKALHLSVGARKINPRSRRAEHRVYWCAQCNGWHLTSWAWHPNQLLTGAPRWHSLGQGRGAGRSLKSAGKWPTERHRVRLALHQARRQYSFPVDGPSRKDMDEPRVKPGYVCSWDS